MTSRFLILAHPGREVSGVSPVCWAWLGMLLAVAAWIPFRGLIAGWVWMWGLVAVLLAGHKAIVLAANPSARMKLSGNMLGYLCGWPGLSLRPFLSAPGSRERATGWITWGAINVASGATVLWIISPLLMRTDHPELVVWSALVGMSLLAHFGAIQMLAGLWRRGGVPVPKLWDSPFVSKTVAEFWSRRWNRAFHEFVRDHVCLPLRPRIGSTPALVAGFVYSGLVHELVLSLPAGGGYGLPTAYFALQALGVWCQRRISILQRPVIGWLWSLLVVLVPMPLAFHEAFRQAIVLPFLSAIGAAG